MSDSLIKALTLAISVLAIVNGAMLLRSYLRDKPILEIQPVYPQTYQWFFRMPPGNFDSLPTRRYGFLIYISVRNRGIRDVSLCEWRLTLTTPGGKHFKLFPISIPQPQLKHADYLKTWPVLGIKGHTLEGDTMVRAGDAVAGFAYYVAEFYGTDDFNPLIRDGSVVATITVRGVYGRPVSARIALTEKTLDEVCQLIPNIDKIC